MSEYECTDEYTKASSFLNELSKKFAWTNEEFELGLKVWETVQEDRSEVSSTSRHELVDDENLFGEGKFDHKAQSSEGKQDHSAPASGKYRRSNVKKTKDELWTEIENFQVERAHLRGEMTNISSKRKKEGRTTKQDPSTQSISQLGKYDYLDRHKNGHLNRAQLKNTLDAERRTNKKLVQMVDRLKMLEGPPVDP